MNATAAPRIYLGDLQAIVADLQAAHPAAGSRVEKGALLFLFRRVERSESGAWYVQSETDCAVEYVVAGDQCTCRDFARHGDQSPCKHLFCRAIAQRAERIEAEALDPIAEELLSVQGERCGYVLTAQGLAALDEARQRDAARCPTCWEFKQHGSLYCEGARCVLDAQPTALPAIVA